MANQPGVSIFVGYDANDDLIYVSNEAKEHCMLKPLRNGDFLLYVDREAFKEILSYLEGNHSLTRLVEDPIAHQEHIINTWLLAGQLGLPSLQNAIVESCGTAYLVGVHPMINYYPMPNDFDNLPDGLIPRQIETFFVAYHAGVMAQASLSELEVREATSNLRPEIAKDIQRQVADIKREDCNDLIRNDIEQFKVLVPHGTEVECRRYFQQLNYPDVVVRLAEQKDSQQVSSESTTSGSHQICETPTGEKSSLPVSRITSCRLKRTIEVDLNVLDEILDAFTANVDTYSSENSCPRSRNSRRRRSRSQLTTSNEASPSQVNDPHPISGWVSDLPHSYIRPDYSMPRNNRNIPQIHPMRSLRQQKPRKRRSRHDRQGVDSDELAARKSTPHRQRSHTRGDASTSSMYANPEKTFSVISGARGRIVNGGEPPKRSIFERAKHLWHETKEAIEGLVEPQQNNSKMSAKNEEDKENTSIRGQKIERDM